MTVVPGSSSLDDLLALLPDNTAGEISPADMRTIVTELYNGAHPPYLSMVNEGPLTLGVAAVFAAIPGTSPATVTFENPTVAQVVISAHVDTIANNNAVQICLALSGATVVAAGAKPEAVLWAGGKSQVQSSLEVSSVQSFAAGATTLTPMYTAQVTGTQVSAMAAYIAVIGGA